jgi:hypothetical protein
LAQGGRGLFYYYSSLEDALRALHPTVHWESSRFAEAGKLRNGFWKDVKKLRVRMEEIGKELGVTEVFLKFSA